MATRILPEMEALAKRLVDERGVAESTAKTYLISLYSLNDKRPFKTVAFLRDTGVIEERLKAYADSTQSSMLGAVISTLTLFKDSKAYKKAFVHYEQLASAKKKERTEKEEAGEKTDKQKENWIEWSEVKKTKEKLQEKADAVKGKIISSSDYEALLHNCVLGLYTDIPPRRNQDYSLMTVVLADSFNDMATFAGNLPADRNYLLCYKKDLIPVAFVFNVYKTAKTYGREFVNADGEIRDSLCPYLKFHPSIINKKVKEIPAQFPFLVDGKGKELSAVNSITRILNKVFGKKVGCSMLRNIFITHKYSEVREEMKETARVMAHSVSVQQNVYCKTDAKRSDSAEPPPPADEATASTAVEAASS